MEENDAITAARKAFAAYETALKAAEEVRKLGPPRDLGTCIMSQASSNGDQAAHGKVIQAGLGGLGRHSGASVSR
jgi:hypothetical protein